MPAAIFSLDELPSALPKNLPAAPQRVQDTGLPPTLLSELVLKAMQQHGLNALRDLSRHLKLGTLLLDTVLGQLRREALVEVQHRGTLAGDVSFQLTQAGRARAAEALTRNLYSGPAPVPLSAYVERVQAQSVADMGLTRERFEQAMASVVMRPELREQLGAAMNSRRAKLLYGPPGAGKTFLCERMASLLQGAVAVPYAVEVHGEIIHVFDELVHRPLAEAAADHGALYDTRRGDARWVLCERPVVITGGELTLEMLDLVFDQRAGFYHAPPHFKANNGLLLVDDLGRQIVTPRQLLNRWIVPMEQQHDYLTLRNGIKFRIPFDSLLFFSTNLRPEELGDEAFLRRIGYKIFVGPVPPEDYRHILRQSCEQFGVPYDDTAFERLLHEMHQPEGRPLMPCYPRDLVSQIVDFARYNGLKPELSPKLMKWAWRNYFATGAAWA
ncbi:ATP-binding protein [Azohydromonas caseinilytica]|uniref:ATP-binding protein n=1 Tax=Azohydromonas caseinilytica TaxID=2728836 RepID=A0A848F7Y7_9BURK|nr:ATP-binding protein [Azohydromonas caseinilytica]NML15298.1 ATP-binding protein [Azohydromonas caseinilytica]